MATFSTHILSSLDGTHLSNIGVSLLEISKGGQRKIIFKDKTDSGGRLVTQFFPIIDEDLVHEIVISMPDSFNNLDNSKKLVKNTIVSSVSVQIKIENSEGTYHMPFILSPYGFSSWVSC